MNTNTNNIRTQIFGRIRIRIIFGFQFVAEYEYEYLLFEYYSNTELFAHLWKERGYSFQFEVWYKVRAGWKPKVVAPDLQ